jgi:tRNA-intron endonuclease
VYPPTAEDPTATHSAELVHVRPADDPIAIRELSLHVRLAGGVRKRMVFAFTHAADAITWVAIARITP